MRDSRSLCMLGVALFAACAPGRSTADDKSAFCDSDAVEIGGSLVGAGSMAWLAMRGRIGPVAGTVSGVASEKFGSMLGPSVCNFIRHRLFDGSKTGSGTPQPPFPSVITRAPGLSVEAPGRLSAPGDGQLNWAHWLAVEAAIKAQRPIVKPMQNPFLPQSWRGLGTLGHPQLGGRFVLPTQPVPLHGHRSVFDGIALDAATVKPK